MLSPSWSTTAIRAPAHGLRSISLGVPAVKNPSVQHKPAPCPTPAERTARALEHANSTIDGEALTSDGDVTLRSLVVTDTVSLSVIDRLKLMYAILLSYVLTHGPKKRDDDPYYVDPISRKIRFRYTDEYELRDDHPSPATEFIEMYQVRQCTLTIGQVAENLRRCLENIRNQIKHRGVADTELLGFAYMIAFLALSSSVSQRNRCGERVKDVETAALAILLDDALERDYLQALNIAPDQWCTRSLVRRMYGAYHGTKIELKRVEKVLIPRAAKRTGKRSVDAAASSSSSATTHKDKRRTTLAPTSPPRTMHTTVTMELCDGAQHVSVIIEQLARYNAVMISAAWINHEAILDALAGKCLVMVFNNDGLNNAHAESGRVNRDALLVSGVDQFKLPITGDDNWTLVNADVYSGKHADGGGLMHDKSIVFGELYRGKHLVGGDGEYDDDDDDTCVFLPRAAIIGSFNITESSVRQSNISTLTIGDSFARSVAATIAKRAASAEPINS